MTDVADKRLTHAHVVKLTEHIRNVSPLVVGDDSRQHGDGTAAVFDKGLHRMEVLRHFL